MCFLSWSQRAAYQFQFHASLTSDLILTAFLLIALTNSGRSDDNLTPTNTVKQAAIDTARSLGGDAAFTHNFGDAFPEWRLNLSRTRVTNDQLKALILPICGNTIRFVSLQKTDISDEVVAVLDCCKPRGVIFNGVELKNPQFSGGLTGLDVSFSNVTSSAINRLIKVHRNLRSIDISGIAIDAKAFDGVSEAALSSLSMRRTAPNLTVASQIARLPLAALDLSDAAVDDDFIVEVSKPTKSTCNLSKSLKRLDLTGTRITDRSLETISAFQGITELNLSKTSLTDGKRVRMLIASLKNLQEIDLNDTSLSAATISDLERAWPELVIRK